MKPSEIVPNRSYVNKSGRSERRVLDAGPHVEFCWLGYKDNAPENEPGVAYRDTRLGKTYYGRSSGKKVRRTSLTAFARWAARAIRDEEAAPWK